MKASIRVAVIGAGMAGQAHAFGYRNATMAADLAGLDLVLNTVVDPDLALARSVAARYGFAAASADVDAVLSNPEIDAVSVALPNFLHLDVLGRAIRSGKHVLAEKPVGRNLEEAGELARLAAASTAVTGVGFSFRRLPGLAAVADAVATGQVGTVHTVRGWYYADYAADPSAPWSWRYSQEKSGGGAVLDIGSHAIDAVQFVAGPIVRVNSAQLRTVLPSRPWSRGQATGPGGAASAEVGPVTNDDTALLTVELNNGATGHIALSRIAAGIPNSLGVEVFGDRGHACFDSIRAGEFRLFRTEPGRSAAHHGPATVFTGPAHPYFTDVAAMPGGGVGTGYAEAFVAEVQVFLRCIVGGIEMDTNFDTAVSMMRVVGAALSSSGSGQAVPVNRESAPPGR